MPIFLYNVYNVHQPTPVDICLTDMPHAREVPGRQERWFSLAMLRKARILED